MIFIVNFVTTGIPPCHLMVIFHTNGFLPLLKWNRTFGYKWNGFLQLVMDTLHVTDIPLLPTASALPLSHSVTYCKIKRQQETSMTKAKLSISANKAKHHHTIHNSKPSQQHHNITLYSYHSQLTSIRTCLIRSFCLLSRSSFKSLASSLGLGLRLTTFIVKFQ